MTESLPPATRLNAPTFDEASLTDEASLPVSQLSFSRTIELSEFLTSLRTGSTRKPEEIPTEASVGPTPRMRSFLAVLPVTTKPATSRP